MGNKNTNYQIKPLTEQKLTNFLIKAKFGDIVLIENESLIDKHSKIISFYNQQIKLSLRLKKEMKETRKFRGWTNVAIVIRGSVSGGAKYLLEYTPEGIKTSELFRRLYQLQSEGRKMAVRHINKAIEDAHGEEFYKIIKSCVDFNLSEAFKKENEMVKFAFTNVKRLVNDYKETNSLVTKEIKDIYINFCGDKDYLLTENLNDFFQYFSLDGKIDEDAALFVDRLEAYYPLKISFDELCKEMEEEEIFYKLDLHQVDIDSALSAQCIVFALYKLKILQIRSRGELYKMSEYYSIDEANKKIEGNLNPTILNHIKEADDFSSIEGKKWVGELYLDPASNLNYLPQLYII